MKSAPGLRGLYPHPEQRGFTPLSVNSRTVGLDSVERRPAFLGICLDYVFGSCP